jgi:hypothetical protein
LNDVYRVATIGPLKAINQRDPATPLDEKKYGKIKIKYKIK